MTILLSVFAGMAFVFVLILFSRKRSEPRAPAVLTEPSVEVRQLASAGKKIQAIKLYRQQTGATLRDSKSVIENI